MLRKKFGDDLVFLAESTFQFLNTFLLFVALGNAFGCQRRAAVGESLFLAGMELRWRQAGLLADLGNGLLLNQMKPQQSDLVVRAPVPSFLLQGLAPKTSSTTFVQP
ncbi:MAG: hypothetical protein INH43_25930 [Acidobacteriaceae bacterium]|nr:hypothetical protein [Acidobacteriaceae bacterium]